MSMTRSQLRLLKSIRRWGELSPDAEGEVGCTGAAFNAVIRALLTRSLIEDRTEGGCSFLAITAAGQEALAKETVSHA
jgi:hypothetical protein